jgi:hypothetical protein
MALLDVNAKESVKFGQRYDFEAPHYVIPTLST